MSTVQESPFKKQTSLLTAFWIFTMIVIAWGAWVRISHSGDGCGDHWPLCDGKFIPHFEDQKTWIEYAHRLMTGLYGIIVVYIFFYFKKKTFNKITRALSLGLLLTMILEAAIGALLVKAELVTVNDSFFRLVIMGLHQFNSFLLTGLTFLLSHSLVKKIEFKISKSLIFFILVATTGAIAALSTTLFPSISLWQGFLSDFQSDSHLFLKLRILHPMLALSVMGFAIYYYWNLKQNRFALEIFIAVFIGILTLAMLSPFWLKISHLLLGHYLWTRFLHSEFLGFKESK